MLLIMQAGCQTQGCLFGRGRGWRLDASGWMLDDWGGLPTGFASDGAEDAGQFGIGGDLGGPKLEHVLLLWGEIG